LFFQYVAVARPQIPTGGYKHIYAVSKADRSVWWYQDDLNTWKKIKQSPVDAVYAHQRPEWAEQGPLVIDSYTKDIYFYTLISLFPTKYYEWKRIGGPGRQFVYGWRYLYGLAVDKGSIWRRDIEWRNGDWEFQGGAACMIAVSLNKTGDNLYALNPGCNRIMRHFSGNQWEDHTFNLPPGPIRSIDGGWKIVVADFGNEAWMLMEPLKVWAKITAEKVPIKNVMAAGWGGKPAVYLLLQDGSLFRYNAFD